MEDAGGLDAPEVREGLRSRRRAWLSLALLGAAMLIGCCVLVNHVDSPASTLASSGVYAEGVVTTVMGQGEAPADGAIDVRYNYAGRTFDAHIYRDDDSPTYRVGEAVIVTLEPAHPQVATVGGSDNLAPGVVWLLIVLLVGGVVAVVLGVALLIAVRQDRRIAAANPWCVERVSWRVFSPIGSAVWLYRFEGLPGCPIVRGRRIAKGRPGGDAATPEGVIDLQMAGDPGKAALLRVPGSRRLVRVRPPRGGRVTRQWQEEFN